MLRLLAVFILTAAPLHAGPFSSALDSPQTATRAEAAPQFAKARLTPGFYQRDPRAAFPNDGSEYCCPVSVATSFIGLARLSLPKLTNPRADLAGQIALINSLASVEYLGTDPAEGTGPAALLRGVRQFVEDQGYRCARLEYEGWRPVGGAQQSCVKAPLVDLKWLTAAIGNPRAAVWANIGWYIPADEPGQWKRTGGHWITLVGTDPRSPADTFIIRNSLLRNQPTPKLESVAIDSFEPELVTASPAPHGVAILPNAKARPLQNLFELKGPALPTKSNTRALLDTAVVLVISD